MLDTWYIHNQSALYAAAVRGAVIMRLLSVSVLYGKSARHCFLMSSHYKVTAWSTALLIWYYSPLITTANSSSENALVGCLLLCLVMYHCAADLIATASSGPWRISWHILNYESVYNCPFRDFTWCSSIFKLKKPNAWIEVSVTTKDHKIEIVYQVVYFTSSLVAPLTHAVLLSSQQSHRYCCHVAAGDENHVSAERFEENILN